MVKNFSVFSKKEFIGEKGERKASWYKCGHIKRGKNGAEFLVLYTQPDTKFHIFPSKENDDVDSSGD